MKSIYVLAFTMTFLPGCQGCVKVYDASGICTWCDEQRERQLKQVDTVAQCSRGVADLELQAMCKALSNNAESATVSSIQYFEKEAIDLGQCDSSSSSLTPGTARFLNSLIGLFQRNSASPPLVVRAAIEETCQIAPAINFTVVAANQRHEDEYPCRDVRVVRVGYSKWISATQSVEDVTLEATVAFGSSHTFNITDAYARADDGTPDPQGVADNIFVLYQAFNNSPDGNKCDPIPLDQGGLSRSFNGLLKDGGRLDVALLGVDAGNTFSFTVNNPPSPAFALSSSTTPITPIPDPRFAGR